MPKKKAEGPPTCKFCEAELKDGKCAECGAYTDSYGLFHRKGCKGFHEECPDKT